MAQRRGVQMRLWVALLGLGALCFGACSVAIGVDDYDFGGTSSSGSGASSSNGSTSSGGGGSSTSTSSSGNCGAQDKECLSMCVPLDDPDFGCASASCDSCDLPNAQEKCEAGACAVASCWMSWSDCDPSAPGCETNVNSSDPNNCGACNRTCPMGTQCCGNDCSKLSDDAEHCSSCNTQCDDDEYCVNSQCVCRPGQTNVGGNCRNFQSDPENCGAQGTQCSGATPLCESGACAGNCMNGHTDCSEHCVDLMTDPDYCGSCFDGRCSVDEVCSSGKCLPWRPTSSVGCSSCPCAACNSVLGYETCMNYPQTMMAICVDTN